MPDRDERREVGPDAWHQTVRQVRDAGFGHFDWLGALDDIGREPEFVVALRLCRTGTVSEVGTEMGTEVGTDAVRITTRVPRDRPELDSIADLFAGAGWHERESAELFDLTFVGGDRRRLLLTDDADAGPLRKDQVLPARSAQPWPGTVEPGESADPSPDPSPDPSREPVADRRADPGARTGVDRGAARRTRRRQSAPGVPDPSVWGDRRESGPPSDCDVADSAGGSGRSRGRS